MTWALQFAVAALFGAWLSPLPPERWRPVLRLALAAGAWALSRSLLDALAVEAALCLGDAFRNPSFSRRKETR